MNEANILVLQCPASGSAKRSGDSPQISQACALNTRSPSSYALLTQQAGTKCLLRHTRSLIYSMWQCAFFSRTRSFFIKTNKLCNHVSITMSMCHVTVMYVPLSACDGMCACDYMHIKCMMSVCKYRCIYIYTYIV